MMQLLIQGLRREYEAVDNMLELAWASDDATATTENIKTAYHAFNSIVRKLILSQTSYHGMTDAQEIVRNSELDMKYVTDSLSEQEMKEREEWHWARQKELGNEG